MEPIKVVTKIEIVTSDFQTIMQDSRNLPVEHAITDNLDDALSKFAKRISRDDETYEYIIVARRLSR